MSPDINGDLRVDLADLSFVAQDYLHGGAFRSDLTTDGIVDLADLAAFAQYFGESCP